MRLRHVAGDQMQADAVVAFIRFGGDALFKQRITNLLGDAGTAIRHLDHQLVATVADIEFDRIVRGRAVQRRLHRIIQQVTNDRHQFGLIQRRRDLPQLAGRIEAQLDAFSLALEYLPNSRPHSAAELKRCEMKSRISCAPSDWAST